MVMNECVNECEQQIRFWALEQFLAEATPTRSSHDFLTDSHTEVLKTRRPRLTDAWWRNKTCTDWPQVKKHLCVWVIISIDQLNSYMTLNHDDLETTNCALFVEMHHNSMLLLALTVRHQKLTIHKYFLVSYCVWEHLDSVTMLHIDGHQEPETAMGGWGGGASKSSFNQKGQKYNLMEVYGLKVHCKKNIYIF